MANNSIHNYFLRIRNSDERTKRRVVAIASSFTMLIVVLLWVVYLNLTLPTLAPAVSATADATQENFVNPPAPVSTNDSFFGVIMRGAGVIGGNIAKQFTSIKETAVQEFSKLGSLATKKNESVITPRAEKFSPSAELEPIPPTKLPE